MFGEFENLFYEVFGFGARNENVWRDAKGNAVELGFAGDVLDRLAFASAAKQGCVTNCRASGEVIFKVSQEPGSILANEVKQQGFCIAACALGMGAAAQLVFAFVEPFAEIHQAAWLSAFNCSAW